MKRASAILLILLAASGCREVPPDTYVEVTGRIFVFNYRTATATFLVTLAKLRPLPEGAVAEAVFEDPRGGGDIIVKQKIWHRLDKIAIESPPVFCVVKDRPYGFAVHIRAAGGVKMQTIEGTVVSSLDQDILPDLPLVEGNGYTPNPKLAGQPSGKFLLKNDNKCRK